MTEGEICSIKDKCNKPPLNERQSFTALKGGPQYRREGKSELPAIWCHSHLSEPVLKVETTVSKWVIMKAEIPHLCLQTRDYTLLYLEAICV
jgi:hypothetical protein